MTKRRLIIMLAVVAMAMAVMAPASAKGPSNERLDDSAKWNCVIAGPSDYVHCFAPGSFKGQTAMVKVFDSTDVEVGGNFLGTELLISEDVYSGQPCASDNGEAYHDLGNGYYACHHYGASG